MSEAILSVKHWGNNLGVRLPQAVARAANLHADQQVRITVEGGRVIIEPLAVDALSLEELLKRFDPARHCGEVMAPKTHIGAEFGTEIGAKIGADKW